MKLTVNGTAKEFDGDSSMPLLWYCESPAVYPLDTGRLRGRRAGRHRGRWGTPLPARHGRGLTVHRSFLSDVAVVMVVAVDEQGRLEVPASTSRSTAGSRLIPG